MLQDDTGHWLNRVSD